MNWFITATTSMFAFSITFLLLRVIANMKIKAELALLYYFAISALALFVYSYSNKSQISVNKIVFLLILATAIFGVIGNILLYKSIGSSPNPGYTLAVVGINTVVVTIVSIFIFKI